MKNRVSRLVLLGGAVLSGLLAGVSCSVKEDRMPCPAYLNISFEDRENITKRVNLLGYNTEEVFRQNLNVQEDYEGEYLVKAVHKSKFNLSAYYGVETSRDSGHYITVPMGTQCDSLYSFQTDVDCTGDMAYANVVFHKQFCTIYVDLNKPLEGQNSISHYRFLVEGNTCGFDLMSYLPLEGSYRIEPAPREGERVVDFRVPRQMDDSLQLTIYYQMDEGPLVKMETFSLGGYMAKMHYDWNTEDLQDIYVKIDLVSGFITIMVEGWEEGYTFSFIEQ